MATAWQMAMANGMANASQSDAQSQSQLPKEDIPPLSPLSDKPAAAAPRAAKAKPRCQIPDGWHPNADGQALAASRGLDLGETLARFTDHHRAKGSLMADWNAAWGTWCRSPYNIPKHTRSTQSRPVKSGFWEVQGGAFDEALPLAGQIRTAPAAPYDIDLHAEGASL